MLITSIEKEQPAVLIKKARKLIVREFEQQNDTLIAYVDDGVDSYDVSIKLDKLAIVTSSCECPASATLCIHKVAVALAYNGTGNKLKSVISSRIKKKTPLELWIDEVDANALKIWLAAVLKADNGLQLNFKTSFANSSTIITEADIETVTAEATKNIIGNRKNIESKELNKIVAAWAKVHKPIVAYIASNITTDTGLLLLKKLINIITEYYYKYNIKNEKFEVYYTSIVEKIVTEIQLIPVFENWKSQLKRLNILFVSNSVIKANLFFHFYKGVFNTTIDGDKKDFLKNNFLSIYNNFNTAIINKENTIYSQFLSTAEIIGFADELLPLLEIDEKDKQFSFKIIEKQVEMKLYDKAIYNCNKIMQHCYNSSDYATAYNFLIVLYKLQNNATKLVDSCEKLLKYGYSYEAYELIMNAHSVLINKSVFRSQLLARAKNDGYNNSSANTFYLQVYANEKNFKKYIENFNNRTSFAVVITFFEPAAKALNHLLLAAIAQIEDNSYYATTCSNKKYYETLWQLIKSYYSHNDILNNLLAKHKSYYSIDSSFVRWVKDKLP